MSWDGKNDQREVLMTTIRLCVAAAVFLALPVWLMGSVYAAERCVAGNLSMCSSDQALTCVQPGRENGCCLKWACGRPHRNEGR